MRKHSALFWFPRLASILFIAFIMMFSLDVFESESGWINILIGLFMHNIPAFAMMIITFFAWKHDLVGVIGYGFSAIVLYLLVWFKAQDAPAGSIQNITISLPALAIAVLYLISWIKTRTGK